MNDLFERAEYDALPGTPPDVRVFYAYDYRDHELNRKIVQEWVFLQHDEAYECFRLTEFSGVFCVEGWKTKPLKEEPFRGR